MLLHRLVYVRPRLSKSLASQSTQDEKVSTIVFCMVMNVWSCKAQGAFVVEVGSGETVPIMRGMLVNGELIVQYVNCF